MSQRFLKYETEAGNPMVDENGVLKQSGSGKKNKTLLFKDMAFPAANSPRFMFNTLDEKIIESLDVLNNGYLDVMSKYRLIFYVDNTANNGGRTKYVMEYDEPYKLDSSANVRIPIMIYTSDSCSNAAINFNPAYGGMIFVSGAEKDCVITCYLEEL